MKKKKKTKKQKWDDGCVCVYTNFVYNYKVTSFPEDWMHAHLNLSVNVCACSVAMKTRQGLLRWWWWWWWCSHDWFLCSRQTLMVTNETSNSVKLTTVQINSVNLTKYKLLIDKQSQFVSIYRRIIGDYAKVESRDLFSGRQSYNCMFKRDTHNDQGYHTHSSNYQNKSMPTERALSVQWCYRLFFDSFFFLHVWHEEDL
jgi:hypothetical protein